MNSQPTDSNKQPLDSNKLLEQASKHFSDGQYDKCEAIYTDVLQDSSAPKYHETLLNRASLYYTIQNYDQCIGDCQQYLQSNSGCVDPRVYVTYLSALLKKGQTQKATQLCKEAHQKFPTHKKIGDLWKLCKEKSIAGDEDQYVQQMFEKLCMHPQVRNYLKEEAFLTKVERMIRNPSLTNALAKMDPRVREAAEAMMMADEDWN